MIGATSLAPSVALALAVLGAGLAWFDRGRIAWPPVLLLGAATIMAAVAGPEHLGTRIAVSAGIALGWAGAFAATRRDRVSAAAPAAETPATPRETQNGGTGASSRVDELETLVATIAHDLREPLRAMRGFSKLIGQRCETCPVNPDRETLGRIQRGAVRAERMIADVAALASRFAEPESLERVPARAIVDRALEDTRGAIEEHGARVRIDDPLPDIVASPRWAVVALRNLIVNAVEHGANPDGVAEIEILGVPADPASGRGAGIAVADRGPGVAAPVLAWLDARGRSATASGTATAAPSPGLGLQIASEIARRHGGAITIRDRPGGGAYFLMTFANAPGPLRKPLA